MPRHAAVRIASTSTVTSDDRSSSKSSKYDDVSTSTSEVAMSERSSSPPDHPELLLAVLASEPGDKSAPPPGSSGFTNGSAASAVTREVWRSTTNPFLPNVPSIADPSDAAGAGFAPTDLEGFFGLSCFGAAPEGLSSLMPWQGAATLFRHDCGCHAQGDKRLWRVLGRTSRTGWRVSTPERKPRFHTRLNLGPSPTQRPTSIGNAKPSKNVNTNNVLEEGILWSSEIPSTDSNNLTFKDLQVVGYDRNSRIKLTNSQP
eukprot:m.438101 g.438101  ORF g.438101 m.438101 type:complete len:259 (+) comp18194_c0_seq1:812-1588(+)